MKVIKRDGSEVPFDISRIENAIGAANAGVVEGERLPGSEAVFIMDRIRKRCEGLARSVGVEEIQDMVSAHAGTSDLRKAAMERGMRSLRQDGWEKVSLGLTSIDEVQRITSTYQISYDIDELEENP